MSIYSMSQIFPTTIATAREWELMNTIIVNRFVDSVIMPPS